MNRTRIRVFARNRMVVKTLPIASFRRPQDGVPAWMQSARTLTGHHPITGQAITDKDLNNRILKGNQSATERRNNPSRDFAEADAETDQELIDLFNLKQLDNLK